MFPIKNPPPEIISPYSSNVVCIKLLFVFFHIVCLMEIGGSIMMGRSVEMENHKDSISSYGQWRINMETHN